MGTKKVSTETRVYSEEHAKLIREARHDILKLIHHAQEMYPHFESERGQADIKDAQAAYDKLMQVEEALTPEKQLTKVQFRIENCGQVAAFFVADFQDAYHESISCYSRMGQHHRCNVEYYRRLRFASERAYLPLKKELESLGYRLEVDTPHKPMKKRKKTVKCKVCGGKGKMQANAYKSDVHNHKTPEAICDDCNAEAARDI